jgi:siroheme synthase-like protein
MAKVKIENELKYYPVAVDLRGKKAVVIGGGTVAERKAISLLEGGASVHIISPDMTSSLRRLAEKRSVKWTRRTARSSDLDGAGIVIAATNDTEANRSVSRWARDKNIPVNVVDRPALSDFISPAVFRARDAIVTVYTDGKDPALSRDLKNFIKERWDEFIYSRNRL